MNIKENKQEKVQFSQAEKQILLKALKKYGHENIKQIAEKLPKKTEEDIQAFFNSVISNLTVVEDMKVNSNFKIFLKGKEKSNFEYFHLWSTYMTKNFVKDKSSDFDPTSFVLKLVGSQLPIENNIDFGLMYSFLQAINEGQKPPRLTKEASDLVFHVTQQIAQQFKSKTVKQKQNELSSKIFPSEKTDKKMKSLSVNEQQKALTDLLQTFDPTQFNLVAKNSKKK